MYAPIPMVPGPVSLHPDVIAAIAQDYPSGQIDADFIPLYHATGRALARLLGTTDDVVIMSGEGMLALWGALKSTLRPGDGVVTVGTGVFGAQEADLPVRAVGRFGHIVKHVIGKITQAAVNQRTVP